MGNKTILWIRDGDSGSAYPEGDSAFLEFQVYNDAMSYGKWLSTSWLQTNAAVLIWNYNGGSGRWLAGSFIAAENDNYPS